jgi:AraC-like DNA-binding protein
MNSGTLAEALGQLVRYVRLWTDEPRLELGAGGQVTVRYQTAFPDGVGIRCAGEAALAEILNSARLVTRRALSPTSVWFSHAAPEDPAPYHAYFGRRVRFSAPSTELVFARDQLALALPGADSALGDLLRKMAGDALARTDGREDGIPGRVRALLGERLAHGMQTEEAVAHALKMSARTLRRRLADDGTTFRELLDSTRAELARVYMRDRRLPMSEVAFLLGFSEPSAFHRAFKRWTRETPAAYRAGRS